MDLKTSLPTDYPFPFAILRKSGLMLFWAQSEDLRTQWVNSFESVIKKMTKYDGDETV